MALTPGETTTHIGLSKADRPQRVDYSPEEPDEHKFSRRAVEAAIWGMPIVSFEAMRRAFFNAGADYGDFCYFSKPADWKLQITTPNASSHYVWFNFNTANGPVVLDFPPAEGAGLFGSILDAWQIPLADLGPEGEDQGKGAKYVILPPEFKDTVPTGVIAVRAQTYNCYAALRAIPASSSETDRIKALALVKRLRLYPLAQWANPPIPKFIDIAGKLFDGIVKMDDTFFDSLAKMVNEEPPQPRDMTALGLLRSLGIEKGKRFKPSSAMRSVFRDAASGAQAEFIDTTMQLIPYWPGSRWGLTPYLGAAKQSGFTFETDGALDVDGRGALFFLVCAAPKKLGAATFYLLAAKDSGGTLLDGGCNYRLRVPPNVPARQFWAATVYDIETAAFVRGAPKVEVNSYHDLLRESDRSADVFFGPRAPGGKDSNWIYTAPGRQWIAFFRFYGPQKALFDKTWRLPDIQKIS